MHEFTARQRPTERGDAGRLLPEDGRYHDDKHVMAELTDLNGRVSRYVLRHLDADAGRSVPTSVDDEHDLGMRLTRLGLRILEQAERRRQPLQVDGSVVERDAP